MNCESRFRSPFCVFAGLRAGLDFLSPYRARRQSVFGRFSAFAWGKPGHRKGNCGAVRRAAGASSGIVLHRLTTHSLCFRFPLGAIAVVFASLAILLSFPKCLAQAATPIFSPAPGLYTTPEMVTISDATPGATIYYTVYGNAVTTNSTQYTGPISVAFSTTVKAIAVAPGYSQSAEADATYIISSTGPGPVITAVSPVLPQPTQTITITGTGFGTQSPYDGNSGFIEVIDESGVTWSAGWVNPGIGVYDDVTLAVQSWTDSQIVLAGFTGSYGANGWVLDPCDQLVFQVWNPQSGEGPGTWFTTVTAAGGSSCTEVPAATPTFAPSPGTYTSTQQVSISDSTPGTSIYYTTDGSAPLISSTNYNGAITVSSSETITAMALAPGYLQSLAAVGTYIISSLTTPTINWPAPAPITFGTPLSATQLDATASVAGTFAYSPSTGTVLPPGTQTLKVNFTPQDTTDYTTAVDSVQITVNQATPAISWSTPAAITYGTALSAEQLDATFSVPGNCVYNPVKGTVLAAGVHTLSVKCTPTDSTDYATESSTVLLTVNPAVLVVTASNQTMPYGGPLPSFSDSITGFVNGDTSSSVDGTATMTTTATARSPVGSYPITFSVENLTATNYVFKYINGSLTVIHATPVISWPTPVSIPVGTPLSATQLDCTSNVPGTFSYNPPSGTVLKVGTYTLQCTLTPNDSVDYTTATATVSISVADFSISAGPSSQSVYTGEAAIYTLTLTSQTGFNLPVSLSCQNLPANTTCAFNPAAVNGGDGTVQVVVQTSAPSPPTSAASTFASPLRRYGPAVFAGILLLFLPKRLRRNRRIWMGCLIIGTLFTLSFFTNGCSGPRRLAGGTPVGTHTITMAGTMTNNSQTLTHTASVTLNVKSLF